MKTSCLHQQAVVAQIWTNQRQVAATDRAKADASVRNMVLGSDTLAPAEKKATRPRSARSSEPAVWRTTDATPAASLTLLRAVPGRNTRGWGDASDGYGKAAFGCSLLALPIAQLTPTKRFSKRTTSSAPKAARPGGNEDALLCPPFGLLVFRL